MTNLSDENRRTLERVMSKTVIHQDGSFPVTEAFLHALMNAVREESTPPIPAEVEAIVAKLSDQNHLMQGDGLAALLETATGAAQSLRAIAVQVGDKDRENEELRLAICGGEDAPGYAASLPLQTILDVAQSNLREWRAASDRALAAEAQRDTLQAEVVRLREALQEIATNYYDGDDCRDIAIDTLNQKEN
jgi:hypothetical protein